MAIHTHKAPYTVLQQALTRHLPFSGPLLRRIQHAARDPSPTAKILATFPEDQDEVPNTASEPWLAAYVDVYSGLATQGWLFSSIESKSTPTSNSIPETNVTISKKERDITKSQLHSLFTYIRADLIPPYLEFLSSQPPPAQTEGKEKDKGAKKLPAHPPSSILVGTVHEVLVGLLVESSKETKPASDSTEKLKHKLRIHRGQDVLYVKYAFPSSAFSKSANGVVDENNSPYTFNDSFGRPGIQWHHLDLVKSRTNIPRSSETLMAMGGVALYNRSNPDATSSSEYTSSTAGVGDGKEMPIAWAFLGFDGSLSTLHVEPEHRGKGLAGVVGREVMKRGGDVFGPTYPSTSHYQENGNGEVDSRQEWYFADVAVENMASRRVMEKMGGEAKWNVAWLVVEVDI